MRVVSRAEAKELGLRRYFTGRACPKGHVTERMVSNTDCIGCMMDRRKVWYERNNVRERGKSKARMAALFSKDPARFKSRAAQFYASNSAKVKAWAKRYRIQNPEVQRALKAARRAHKKGAPGKYTAGDIVTLLRAQNGRCVCGTDLSDGFHVDHIVPLIRGGSNWPANLQLLCASCNSSKGAKTMAEWKGRAR